MDTRSSSLKPVKNTKIKAVNIFKNMQQKKLMQQNANDFFASYRPQLPQNFYEDIIDLEMELDKETLSIETIQSLLELYSKGVEYFESINSVKYLNFKTKTQNLLLRENVNECLRNEQYKKQISQKNETQDDVILDFEIHTMKNQTTVKKPNIDKPQTTVQQIKIIQHQDNSDCIQKMVQNMKQEQVRMGRFVQSQIEQQDYSVQQRLERRKQYSLSRSQQKQ